MAPEPGHSPDIVHDDTGGALVEFIFGTLVLLLPLVYIALSFSVVQGAALAAQAAAVDAARMAARYPASGEARARELARMHFSDFGLDDTAWELATTCSARCDEAGSLVTARITAHVHTPGLSVLFGKNGPGTITITAAHTDQVAPSPGELGDD